MREHAARLSTLILSLMLVSSLGIGCGVFDERPPDTTPPQTTPANSNFTSPANNGVQELASWTAAVEKIKPSVVAIETDTGSASGWIIDSEGIIVTNQHVIENAGEVGVMLHDGNYYTAEKIFADPVTDIAILIIDAHGLPVANIGSSSDLRLGQPVAVVGNALGLGISMKGGWVSRLDVSTVIEGRDLYGLIETDAAMNPGNSGGPLINLSGEVIGIANAKLVDVVVEGVAYAISIDSALPIIDRLIEDGEIAYPFLGVQGLITVDQAVASFYELDVEQGVLILDVASGSGASEAGLEGGDVLLEVDQEPITTVGELVQIIRSKEIGQTIAVTYHRDGEEHTVNVTLTERPDF